MKPSLIVLMLSGGVSSSATVISENWQVSATIPDNSTLGWSDTRIVSSPTLEITDIQILLEISGGFNGDLYAYVTHGSGFSVLLNRVGRTAVNPDGFLSSGMNVTFSGVTGQDAHGAGDFYGHLQPDGRETSPLVVTNADPRTALLSSFHGIDPNGAWTLFIADLSPLGQSTVVSWGIVITTNVTAVPEPTAVLGTGALLALAMWRRRRTD